jgi:hypothetical protein
MEGIMRSRSILLTLSLALIMAGLACARKPSSDNSNATSDTGNTGNTNTASDTNSNNQKNEAPKPPLVVPSGTTVTVSLGTALGSKLSTSGQSFTGTVAKDVVSENTVAIPRGTGISGTVVNAKPLGKLAGGAVLRIRLDSININGSDVPVHASARSFSIKGKGKRTGVMAGGGAALGGIVGGIAGGGKGAAIGMLAGGGAGGAGASFTGNKEIVLPVESAVAFQLTQPVEITQ